MKDILTFHDVISRERINLQRGMNYRPAQKTYSILLMSALKNSAYNDGFDEKGKRLTYEGEDTTRRESRTPKEHDQPLFSKSGRLTNNALFFKAVEDFKYRRRKFPETVQVYEKIANNVWSDKGRFDLVDVEYRFSEVEGRKVFKFILQPKSLRNARDDEEIEEFEFSRRIPTAIKQLVWERDGGRCIKCGDRTDLHFDHVIPWSKGGSSADAKNVQILCGRHNQQKSNHIL